MEQLSEIETQNIAGADKAVKGKAPAKGGKVVQTNEDQLRQELEQITKIQPEGWVLLDFPRTLNQAKTMEKLMTGYTCLVDQLKSSDQMRFE